MHYSSAFTDNFEQLLAGRDICLVYYVVSIS